MSWLTKELDRVESMLSDSPSKNVVRFCYKYLEKTEIKQKESIDFLIECFNENIRFLRDKEYNHAFNVISGAQDDLQKIIKLKKQIRDKYHGL